MVYFTINLYVEQDIWPDILLYIRHTAFILARYPAKPVSGASLACERAPNMFSSFPNSISSTNYFFSSTLFVDPDPAV
jgi:hypothetical protein